MAQLIGKTLQEERLRQGISLHEVSKQTLIRIKHLSAIEDDDFSMLASDAQIRGFIKIYSDFLKIDPIKFHIDNDNPNNINEALPVENTSTEQIVSQKLDNKSQSPDDEIKIPQDQSMVELLSTNNELPESVSSKEKPKSQIIFEELGDQLHERRAMLNFSLSNVEEYIHIKEKYLEALESGNHSELPSPVHTRGMIINYSRFLNLDENMMLLLFAEGLQERRLENSKQKPNKNKSISPVSSTTLSLRKFFTLDLFFGSFLIIGILIFLIWGTSNMLSSGQRDAIQPTIPNIADVLISTNLSPNIVNETPDPNESILGTIDPIPTSILVLTPFVSTSPIQITIVSRQSSWIRVISDGKLVFEGRIEAGNASTYNADTNLELVSGNAAALQVFFKEEDLGTLGLLGQVVTLIFDKNGLIRPTITPSPTATSTPQISTTPTPELIN